MSIDFWEGWVGVCIGTFGKGVWVCRGFQERWVGRGFWEGWVGGCVGTLGESGCMGG